MSRQSRLHTIALGSLVAGTGLVSALPSVADAATFRANYYSATSVCEAPLPAYDATLRKRPLGITNEGPATIFISCSVPTDYIGDMDTNIIQVFFTSMGAGATVTCNLVAGNRPYGSSSVAGSVAVPSGGSGFVNWSNVSKVTTWGSLNFSCNVPDDIEMNLVIVQQNDAGDGF